MISKREKCTWADSKNSDLYTKPGLDTELKNARSGVRYQINEYDYFISSLYVCMVNTIYLFSFVKTPRKFIIAELSIRKLVSSSVLIIPKSRNYKDRNVQSEKSN